MAKPKIVPAGEWRQARDELLKAEKEPHGCWTGWRRGAAVSRWSGSAPLSQIQPYREQMGWTFPFVSSRGTSFSGDCGAGPGFVLSAFLRDRREAVGPPG